MRRRQSKDILFAISGVREKLWDFNIDSLPGCVRKNAGIFTQCTVESLMRDIGESKREGKIRMTTRSVSSNDKDFDTSLLQLGGKEGDCYQVASNFNCHEVASRTTDIFSGGYLTDLSLDSTQGPSAASGAPYGAIARMSVHRKSPINLLSDAGLEPTNGKLNCPHKGDKTGSVDYRKIGVGIQQKTLACARRNPDTKTGPRISQIYVSTVICREGSDTQQAVPFLRAAYRGTYLAAAAIGTKKLVLTLVGGGVFGNPMSLIIDEIANAHRDLSGYLDPACTVVLPVFQPSPTLTVILARKHRDVFDIVQT